MLNRYVSVDWDCIQFDWCGVADGSGVGGDSFRWY